MANLLTVFFAFIYELIGGAFLLFIFALLFRRYLEKRTKPPLFLALAVLSMGVGVLTSSLGRLTAIFFFPDLNLYFGFQYPPFMWIALALTGNIIGDVFFLLFINYVFYDGNKKFTLVAIIFGMALGIFQGMMIPTPQINPMTYAPVQVYINLFQIVWMTHALFTFFTGGIIIYSTLKASAIRGVAIRN